MEITDFTTSVQNSNANNFVRALAQQVKSELSTNCGKREIEVSAEVFDDLCRVVQATPTEASIFRFIRVYDMNDNSVDIQTRK